MVNTGKRPLTIQPDALAASGDTTSADPANFLSTKGSRDVWSIYWEVRVPVTSPIWHCPGLYSLELGYQERFDNYSDFGSTEKPKFFFRWQPIDSSLTLRGTYNEAFHAPALYELFTSQFHDIEPVDDPATVLPGDPLGRPPGTPLTPPGTRIKQTLGGNPNLRPETAYEWTYGAVVTPGKWWSPLQGLTLQADFYHIDLRNVIIDRDFDTILGNNFIDEGTLPNGAPRGGPFSELIQRDPVTGAVLNVNAGLQNVSRIITEGLDYEASYQLDTSIFGRGDFGTFTLPSMVTIWLGMCGRGPRRTANLILTISLEDQDLAHSRETAGIPVCFTTAQQAHGSADSMPARSSTTLGSIGRLSPSLAKSVNGRHWTSL